MAEGKNRDWKTAVNWESLVADVLTWEKEGEEEGWKLAKEGAGVKSYRRQKSGDKQAMFKGHYMLAGIPQEKVHEMFKNEQRAKWDVGYQGEIVEDCPEENLCLLYVRRVPPSGTPLSTRDFLQASYHRYLDDGGWIIVGCGVDSPERPIKKDPVRANVHLLAIVTRPVEDGKSTQCMNMSQIDMKLGLLSSLQGRKQADSPFEWQKNLSAFFKKSSA